MRNIAFILALAGGLMLSQRGLAQTLPAEMIITAPRVEVRSGPTKEYQATSILKQGDRVLVLRESKDQPGWLAIKPPAGSFSWVSGKHVKLVDGRTGYVDVDSGPAPVMPGSSIVNKPPTSESVKLAPGFLVTVIDKPFVVDGNTWLIITPPPTEVRFIPADAVRPVGSGVPIAPGKGGNPLIVQADDAFNSRQFDKAKSLYKQAAERTSDYEEKIYCYGRLMSLEKGTTTPGHPFHMAGGKTTTPGPITPATGKTLAYPPQWSTWGTLKKAAFEKDGQAVYVLESKERHALLYVISQPGTSLREYVGRTVCLYGTITYRTDDRLKTHYMVASHVATP
jgi:hypothetical protein